MKDKPYFPKTCWTCKFYHVTGGHWPYVGGCKKRKRGFIVFANQLCKKYKRGIRDENRD
jgi:hypothetical protein